MPRKRVESEEQKRLRAINSEVWKSVTMYNRALYLELHEQRASGKDQWPPNQRFCDFIDNIIIRPEEYFATEHGKETLTLLAEFLADPTIQGRWRLAIRLGVCTEQDLPKPNQQQTRPRKGRRDWSNFWG